MQEQIKAILGPSMNMCSQTRNDGEQLAIRLVENVRKELLPRLQLRKRQQQSCSYFHEIAGHEIEFDTFFVNLNVTNFIDLKSRPYLKLLKTTFKLMRILDCQASGLR